MPPKEVIDYIKNCQKEGFSKEAIKNKLLEVGWNEKQIKESFNATEEKDTPQDEAIKNIKTKKPKIGGIKNKLKIILPVIFALLFMSGVSAFFIMRSPSPQDEIMESLKNMQTLNSLSSTFGLNFEATTNQNNDFQGSFTSTSKVDSNNMEGEFTFEGQGMFNGTGGSLKGSLLAVNDKAFIKLDQAPFLGMFLPLPISEIKGKNILVAENLSEELNEENLEKLNKNPLGIKPEEVADDFFKDDVDPEVAEEFLKDLGQGLWDYEAIIVASSTEEEIRGTSVRRYDLKLNLENSLELFDVVIKDYEQYLNKPEEQEEVYYCVDNEGNTGTYKGKTINPQKNSCPEVFPEGSYDKERTGSYVPTISARLSAYDTQIKSEMSQIRSSAEQHYYSQDGSYNGYNNSEDWLNLKEETPKCSKAIMDKDGYQINISQDGQKYATWAPLCLGSKEAEKIMKEDLKKELIEIDEKLKDSLSASVWTDGEYIHKVEVNIEGIENYSEDYNNFKLNLGIDFEDFNQPLGLEEPEEYMDLEELEEKMRNTQNEAIGGNNMQIASAEAYDTHIRAELSQSRTKAEQYYYDNKGSYQGYDDSSEWKDIESEIPDCSAQILGESEYQINIANDGQNYVSWAPLCAESQEVENPVYYCVDALGNAGKYQNISDNKNVSKCEDLFEIDL